MKTVKYFMMMCALVAMAASCTPRGYDFETVVKDDINFINENYPNSKFFESRVVFNGAIDSVKTSKLYVDAMCDVFQVRDTAILIKHEAGKFKEKPVVDVHPRAHVMEDSPIEYPTEHTLSEALHRLLESDAIIPHSDKVTLRRPFGPNPNNNPQYIFGSNRDTTYAFVNANTLDVTNHYDYERADGDTAILEGISNLDHDIYVPNVTKVIDTKYTGFDVSVGPTGWPWADPVEWEVALFYDNDAYYARLIFHEYMLWWSWDYPYVAVKIPKANVGDLANDEKLRNQVLWDITYTTERSYSYSPYIKNAKIERINGHTVTFGNYACKYEKYYVICDENCAW